MTGKVSQDDLDQIVFLIDSNPSFWGSTLSSVEAANAIRLCVLKILTYFADCGKRKRSSLRWGYKFFSSRSLSHQFERHEFKEFTVTVFEEFETLVCKRFNESFSHDLQGSLVEHNSQDGDESTRHKKAPAAAKCISCAFTNTVHDFQWEKPDLSSPIRRTRDNAKSLPGNCKSKTQNVMFLLSGYPSDEFAISYFTGENSSSVATLESLNNILMPPVLNKEFKDRNITLQWVNTGNGQYEKNTNMISLLESFVEQLGGCIIPLSSVIYSGSFSSLGADSIPQNQSSCHEIKKTFCTSRPLFPSKTVMNFFLAGKTKKSSDFNLAQYQFEEKTTHSGNTALMCSSGIDDKIHCSVLLNSMFEPKSVQPNPRSFHEVANVLNDGPTNSLTGNKAAETFHVPTLLWIRGVINHSSICPTWLHPMKAYTCIGLECTQRVESTNSASSSMKPLSGWFQELLLSLSKGNKLLVIDFIDCDSGLPVSAVLQPLTSICGVISVISSEFLVRFEKLLLWNDKTALLDRENARGFEASSKLLRKAGDKTGCKIAGQAAKPSEVFFTVPRSETCQQNAAANEERKYEAGLLDPWLSFPVFDSKDGLGWGEPRRSDSESEERGDDESNEASPMKQLKILYSNKEEKQKSFVLRERRSLRHKKEKLATPRKSKVKQDSLKPSANVVEETEKVDQEGASPDQSITQPFVEGNIKFSGDNCNITGEVNMTGDTNGMEELPQETKVFVDEVELVKTIDGICNKVIFEGVNIPTEVSNIMRAVTRFYQEDDEDRQKENVSQFLKKNVLQTTTKLREKYEGCDAILREQQQVREYQLQILLRTEIAVLVNADENSALVEEVTVLLRTISFVKDPNFLTVYLREILLDRYRSSLPKFLCGVYEGLMMRPPREVLSPSRWSSDEESPVRRSVNSVSSAKQDSSQPRSSGCRILTRHMSISDVVGKRREIVVPARAKPKEKDKKKKEKSQGNNIARGESKKQEKTVKGHKTPVKLVRRNLFTESEGVDENKLANRIPRKRKLSEGGKKDERRRRFHRRNTVASFSKATVQETPAHKQVSNALWRKQDRARKRSRVDSEVHVLQESPLKELQAVDSLPRRSPRRHPGAIFQRSQSFYGRSNSAGPLTRTRSFTGVRPRGSPKKEPTEALESPAKKTPQKLTFATDSPLRFSPRHKGKFSLHSVLSTAKEIDQKEDRSQKPHKPTTPKRQIRAPTRSSPRLLKKRSFSCIGFSSVPFLGNREQESTSLGLEPGFDGWAESPVRGSPQITAGDKSPSLKGHTQPHDLESLEQLDKLSKAHDDNLGTPMKNVTSPAVRSSPRLLEKREKGELSKEVAGHSSCKPTDSRIAEPIMASPSPSKQNVTVPRTPVRDHSFEECVVLLTPLRGPLTSPVNIRPQDFNETIVSPGEKRSSLNEITQNGESPQVPSPTSKPPHSSTRLSGSSFDFAEHQGKRLSLKLRKRTPMSKSATECTGSTSQGTEWFICLTEESQEDCKISPTSSPSSLSPATGKHSSEAQFKSPGLSCGSLEKGGHCQLPTQCKSPDLIRGSPVSRGNDPVAQFKSPPHSSRRSPARKCSLQNQSPQHSTPPVKKGKRKRNGHSVGACNSAAGSKSSSPLNQLLRQQKRKRCFSSSPADKCSSEAIYSHMRDTPSKNVRARTSMQGVNTKLPSPIATENISRSSAKEDGLLTEMDNTLQRPEAEESQTASSPPKKKRRIDKSVVFGGKHTRKEKKAKKQRANSSLSSDTSFEEEDEVLQSPGSMASSLRRRHMNKAPLSASSIKILQESPLLCNSTGSKHTQKAEETKKENANSSLSSDTSFEEEDEVFQSPGSVVSSLKRRHMNKTPLSASSIKILQESPLLCNSTVSPPSRFRNISDLSQKSERHGGKGRLSRRKFGILSGHNEECVSDAFVEDQEEPIGFNLRKRLKVSTS